MTLCKNAQIYNEDQSLIYSDSIVLQTVFTNTRERLEQELEDGGGVDDEDTKEGGEEDEESGAGPSGHGKEDEDGQSLLFVAFSTCFTNFFIIK